MKPDFKSKEEIKEGVKKTGFWISITFLAVFCYGIYWLTINLPK